MLDTVAPLLPPTLEARLPAPPMQGAFRVVEGQSPERRSLEAEIRTGYAAHFGAEIEGFMPMLARYAHPGGAGGIIGLREAAAAPLFLERYLPAPIETVIAGAAAAPIARTGIIEVGQFVVASPGVARDLFRDLVPFLSGLGYEWICFTGTGRIRALVSSAGLQGLCVGDACEAQAGDTGDRWGSYYAHDPAVIIGKLSDPAGRWCTGQAQPAQRAAGA